MPSDIGVAKRAYRRLLARNDRQALTDLLLDLHRQPGLPSLDQGWVLWNLCDQYAILRDAQTQIAYQSEFATWSHAQSSPHYLHWVVSDATHAMTLFEAGYIDNWWAWYLDAQARAPKRTTNRGARFEAHRATTYACVRHQHWARAHESLAALEALLPEDPQWINQHFAVVTFYTLQLELAHGQGDATAVSEASATLLSHLDTWYRAQPQPQPAAPRPLLGSWAHLTGTRPSGAILIAIHNAGCSLVLAQHYEDAERLFRLLDAAQYTFTPYGAALALLACWHNRYNAHEVRTLFAQSRQLTLETVAHFAPELASVLEI